MAHFAYPFIRQWTFGYCEQCCPEHGYITIRLLNANLQLLENIIIWKSGIWKRILKFGKEILYM